MTTAELHRPLDCRSDDRGVTTLTLNRPECHNALDTELMETLAEAVVRLDADPSVRILVLTGAGDSFCSGADLGRILQLVEREDGSNEADAAQLASMMAVCDSCGKPLVARVNGSAFGGGVGLIACCDLAIGVDSARFAFSEVRLGLIGAVIAPYVARAIGARQARALMLTAAPFSAVEALRIGLLHAAVDDKGLDDAIEQRLARLLQGERHALAETKRLLRQIGSDTHPIVSETAALTAEVRASPAARARLQAFIERHGTRKRG